MTVDSRKRIWHLLKLLALTDLVPAPKEFSPMVRGWGRRWGVKDLAAVVTIEFSNRLRRSLGRCQPSTGRIRLAAFLRDGPPEVLKEVLCHEVAHVAVHRLHGSRSKPHGSAWPDLVKRAGFEPRTRAPAAMAASSQEAAELTSSSTSSRSSSTIRYEHRCPVCHTVRIARRPVPSWHCAECLDAGLRGEMTISRVETKRDEES